MCRDDGRSSGSVGAECPTPCWGRPGNCSQASLGNSEPQSSLVRIRRSSAPCVVATACDAAAARQFLTPSERREHAGLPSAARRRDYRVGRLAAKRAVAAVTGAASLHHVRITRAPDGAPSVASAARARVRVTIAHCDGRAAAAAAGPGLRVGADLERTGAVAPHEARYFATPREIAGAHGAELSELWALKEAAWKLLGGGRATPFTAIELDLDPNLRGIRTAGRYVAAEAVITHPWPGYVMAVVTCREDAV